MEDQFIKLNISKKHMHGRLRAINFKEGDYHIVYLPGLGLSGYGDTIQEAQELIKLSLEAFVEDLFKLPEHQIFKEFNDLGWRQEKFFKKKLRNLSPTTFEDIKREFNIPDNTQITETAISV